MNPSFSSSLTLGKRVVKNGCKLIRNELLIRKGKTQNAVVRPAEHISQVVDETHFLRWDAQHRKLKIFEFYAQLTFITSVPMTPLAQSNTASQSKSRP